MTHFFCPPTCAISHRDCTSAPTSRRVSALRQRWARAHAPRPALPAVLLAGSHDAFSAYAILVVANVVADRGGGGGGGGGVRGNSRDAAPAARGQGAVGRTGGDVGAPPRPKGASPRGERVFPNGKKHTDNNFSEHSQNCVFDVSG